MRYPLSLLATVSLWSLPACMPPGEVDVEGAQSALDRTTLDAPVDTTTAARTLLDHGGLSIKPTAIWNPPTNPRICPPGPTTIREIREADPDVNRAHHDQQRRNLMQWVHEPNTTILLGPNVVLDFSDVPATEFPLRFEACVTLKSVAAFPPVVTPPTLPDRPPVVAAARTATAISVGDLPPIQGELTVDWKEQSARTPSSPGPVLKFGPHRKDNPNDTKSVFFMVWCSPGDPNPPDNVTLSGFRIYGPTFEDQHDFDIGIKVFRCLNVEISNMEIAGWGGQAILIEDNGEPGPGQEQPDNRPGERIGRYEQVRIFRNYIHHNQHSSDDGHAAGYGVEVHHGAWAQVYENLFDFNRHAIAAAWDTGGYQAMRNLVLKGGGFHNDYVVYRAHTHQFDIHGKYDPLFDGSGKGGPAGYDFLFADNAFQYRSDNAIFIRGTPRHAVIRDNIFPHPGLEDDWGDDAVAVYYRSDLGKSIFLGPNNVINYDTYGRYGVCDFDGDGVDDLFLATGRTWWFSSYGELPWSYLSARTERLEDVRLGYFDGDKRCDVMTEQNGRWLIASGGTGGWHDLGAYGVPLSEVAFGRFDPSARDHRPGVTKQTTHAFRRLSGGEWMITPLTGPAWQYIGGSSFPMSKLRFGDFTGDGVTDVLAVQDGRWSISDGGRSPWVKINAYLSDDVSSLFIADLNHNNIDDLIKLETSLQVVGDYVNETLTWWVSDDARSRWRKLKSYTFKRLLNSSPLPLRAFAGRFGAAPGGGVLLTGHDRIGRFYSEAESAAGARPDWTSTFSY